uniref:Uncharacterized protein n=1 Tax=Parascaris equorum TaxID=6256 RepID=A0A914RG18_PAREQ
MIPHLKVDRLTELANHFSFGTPLISSTPQLRCFAYIVTPENGSIIAHANNIGAYFELNKALPENYKGALVFATFRFTLWLITTLGCCSFDVVLLREHPPLSKPLMLFGRRSFYPSNCFCFVLFGFCHPKSSLSDCAVSNNQVL